MSRQTFVASLLTAAMFLSLPVAAKAESAAPPATEKVEILPITFSANGMSGAGGERLRGELKDAQFIAVGEDHGLAGSPQLTLAIAHDAEAIDDSPLYHAAEVGPHTANWVSAHLKSGGVDALGAALATQPWAIPFLTNAEDAALAAPFANENRLWGIDQEFLGATSILLDVLSARTRDKAVRKRLADWRDRDRAALADGNFGGIMLMTTATAEDFAALQRHFADDREARAIVDALTDSADIYHLNLAGKHLQNNEERALLMREYFLTAYRSVPAPAPRVLLKMGANHLGRGTTPTAIYDLGSLLPGLAAANGQKSLHIAYIPMAGSVLQIAPSPKGFTQISAYEDTNIGPILDAAGIAREMIPATGHALIPVAALRHQLAGQKLQALPEFARFLLLGFDYLVTTRDAKPATNFETLAKRPS
ncbi:hypothetical protein [Sphingopyxis witflariensis]|uniref:Erythromycin esterase n=1 Tax=Sphingopyxis witflariensis TaxID=173675 RepID=A0A246JEP0_9SPHN|nr:hypothetical protein [Sphingopyxis witflariensis]OWQ91069.1 hypothetical protein CDQ91_19660 [Sphingopyxis witflariensis]